MVYDYCGHCIILFYFESFAFSHLVIYVNIACELKNSTWTEMILLHCFSLCCWPAVSWCLDKWKRTEFVKYFLLQHGSQENFQSWWNCGLDNICYNSSFILKKIIQKAPLEWSVSTHFVTDCSFLKHFFWSSYKLPPSWALLKPLTKLYKSRAYKWSLRKPSRPYIIVKVASNQVQFLLPPLSLGLVLGIQPAYSVAINNVF